MPVAGVIMFLALVHAHNIRCRLTIGICVHVNAYRICTVCELYRRCLVNRKTVTVSVAGFKPV